MGEPAARWLDRAPADWPALLSADPSSTAAHRPEVWAAFAAVQPGVEVRVAVVERDGRLLGGAPAVLERRAGLHWLHALPMMLPAAPLAHEGEHARVDALVAGAFDALAREARVVGGEWSLYREARAPVAPDDVGRVAGETRWLEAAIVDLTGGVEAAVNRGARKHRQALHHARRRGGLAFAESPAMLDAAYALHVAQSRRWRGHRALPIELSRRLLAGADPVARLFGLRDRQGLVSAALALDGPNETFVWWSGTHPDGRRRQAFTLLLWNIVEWAAARGRARVNLGASTGLEQVAAFKQALGAEGFRYPVRWLAPRNRAPHARAIAWLQTRLRRGRARGEAA